ncbi:MAG TPA: MlaD family protein [Candidatus Omnitrophota bacterium]|nr:MlaD family protein [Candidatus Omnitrophota bacterium]
MKKKTNETAVGVFVVVGFILLTMVVFFISGAYFVRPGYKINVMYSFVSILDKGAPVRMAGVRVGEVSKVDLMYDVKKQITRVKVKLFIEKGIEIRENYDFMIQGTHVLSEPHIEIKPKPGNFPVLRKGATVEGVNLVAVEELIDRAHEILSSLSAIMNKAKTEIGSDKTMQDLKVMITNFSELSVALNDSLKGAHGNVKQSLQNIDASSASLSAILSHVEKGEGTVGKLLVKDDLYNEMDALVKDVRAHPWKLLKKDSTKKRFLFF